jgi:hypothetical protein
MRRGAGSCFFAALAAAVAVAGCGSGARQDAQEPSGNFPVQVTTAGFPASQRLAQHTQLVLSVRNAGRKTIPDLAVTICNVTCTYPAPLGQGTSVAAFSQYLSGQGLANHSRPVWIVDRPPGGCGYSCLQGGAGGDVSAASNTWQGGPLKPGQTTTFKWAVTAVASGRFVVAWEIAAGLNGKAKAVAAGGTSRCGPDRTPCGTFPVTIAHAPAQSYVNDAGQIVQGQ